MTRLIDAERLKALIFNACIDEHFKPTKLLNWDNITNIINNAPTISPEKALMDKLKGGEEIDNAPTIDITEEQAIDKLHETGWMQRHDKEMTESPQSEHRPGYWVEKSDCEGKKTNYTCDVCGFDDGWKDYNWCPICGIKMVGVRHIEEEEDEEDE